MTSKIRVKVGQIEVEFEGSEEYIKSELPRAIKSICSSLPDMVEAEANTAPQAAVAEQRLKIQMTTANIAAKLGCRKHADLVLAACAHLDLDKNSIPFSRADILQEMKTAKNYYTTTMGSNLSSTISSLVKANELIERSPGNYALHADTKMEMENKLK